LSRHAGPLGIFVRLVPLGLDQYGMRVAKAYQGSQICWTRMDVSAIGANDPAAGFAFRAAICRKCHRRA